LPVPMAHWLPPRPQILKIMNIKSLLIIASATLASASFATLKVVTTTADLASIASMVGGSNVSVSSIITGARDAHRIEAKPSYMSRVSSADVFIAIGLELEVAYERPILDGSGNSKVALGAPGHIYASEFAYILDKPTGAVTRAQGDIHPDGNPHILLDPYNGRLVGIGIARKFEKLDKAHAASYETNLTAFLNRLDTGMFGSQLVQKFGGTKLWQWHNAGGFPAKLASEGAGSMIGGWAAKGLAIAGKPVLTYHRSMVYLANRFGMKIVDELEPKPGLEPTPGHLAEVIRVGKEKGVKAVVLEPFFSAKSAQLVASRIDARVVVIPQSVGQATGANDYIGLFDVIVGKLAEAVK
ncbi:MAG: metal ABC transporter substrate-binding protein, partial [Armatimonadetes bacterium]|nr:metal ABC transporter substrate-binding protein [Armatimonadota bacterium]